VIWFGEIETITDTLSASRTSSRSTSKKSRMTNAGKPVPFAKSRVIDVALSANWDEARAKVLEAGSVVPGSVFAWFRGSRLRSRRVGKSAAPCSTTPTWIRS
jgi:hypothetical protein